MAEEYLIALLGLFGTAGAVFALVWAIRRRQLQTGDQAMYEALADDEPDYGGSSVAPSSVPKRLRWMFAAALASVFLLVCWLVVQTVRIGTRTSPPPPPAQRLPSSE